MQKITDEMLQELFKYREDIERIVYSDKYILAKEGTIEHDLYKIVSDIAFKSGMSYNFSYEIMSKACDIVADYSFDSDYTKDDLFAVIDNAIPVYTNELMTIYQQNWHLVDDANEDLGGEGDSVAHAQRGWYYILDITARELSEKVSAYNDAK